MPITDEQAKQIKEQIFKQVESFPADRRDQIKEYITKMNNEELEEFLIKNKMIRNEGSGEDKGDGSEEDEENSKEGARGSECIMCLISGRKVEAYVVYEDKDYLGALEINPITKGHSILIPKQHIKEAKDLKAKAFSIAKKIGKHLVKKLGAENFQVNTGDEIGHALINIIPKYKNEAIDFKRKPAKKEELLKLYESIGKIETKAKTIKVGEKKPKQSKSEEEIKVNVLKLPRRIP
jgi:histidine triad (HIT) family protein